MVAYQSCLSIYVLATLRDLQNCPLNNEVGVRYSDGKAVRGITITRAFYAGLALFPSAEG